MSATGLRPEEWLVLERGDIDRRNRLLNVRRTISGGELVELAKTDRSRRQVPLTRRPLAALDQIPPQVITPLLFTAPADGLINLGNFRRREWAPASAATSSRMGTSVAMIEEPYGVLLGGAVAAIAARQGAFGVEQDRAFERPSDELP